MIMDTFMVEEKEKATGRVSELTVETVRRGKQSPDTYANNPLWMDHEGPEDWKSRNCSRSLSAVSLTCQKAGAPALVRETS